MTMHGLEPIDRFMAYVLPPNPVTGCWIWAGAVSQKGALGEWARFRLHPGSGGSMKVGRASWLLHNGEIPDGLHVLHRCDNGLCVNPTHLFLGTHSDNMADRAAKGRHVIKADSPDRHRYTTASGTRAQLRVCGILYRKHFPRGTDDAIIQDWISDTRQAAEDGLQIPFTGVLRDRT
jgi:hypothetical protein